MTSRADTKKIFARNDFWWHPKLSPGETIFDGTQNCLSQETVLSGTQNCLHQETILDGTKNCLGASRKTIFERANTFWCFSKKKLFDVRSAGFGDFFHLFQFPCPPSLKKANSPKTEKVVRQPSKAVKIKKMHTQKLSPMTLFSVKEKKMITTMFFFSFLGADSVHATVHMRFFSEKIGWQNIFFLWF